MRKLFRSELEKFFFQWTYDFLLNFAIRHAAKIGDEDFQQIKRIARIVKEIEEGYE